MCVHVRVCGGGSGDSECVLKTTLKVYIFVNTARMFQAVKVSASSSYLSDSNKLQRHKHQLLLKCRQPTPAPWTAPQPPPQLLHHHHHYKNNQELVPGTLSLTSSTVGRLGSSMNVLMKTVAGEERPRTGGGGEGTGRECWHSSVGFCVVRAGV